MRRGSIRIDVIARVLVAFASSFRGSVELDAAMIACRAIQNGREARFETAAHLIDDLSAAASEGRLREVLVQYVQLCVLVIDEFGGLIYGSDAAIVLFHVVDHRYLHGKSMLFTGNEPLANWGSVLHDPDLTEAITDRVLNRGRVI